MKVLLTGANGFVGSHILDRLCAEGVPVRLLLRTGSDTRFIAPHLTTVEVVRGGLDDPEVLRQAMTGITHLVHAAGATRGLRAADLYTVNQFGTRRVVEAFNAAGTGQRFLLLSSLAVSGPATPDQPAREDQPPGPVSEYGRSKAAAEREVLEHGRTERVLLRLAAVYGPRDREFLRLFRAARAGVMPVFGGGSQGLSLVYAPDAAEVVWRALQAPMPCTPAVNVAGEPPVTASGLAAAVAAAVGRRAWRLPLPRAVVPVGCALAAAWARVTGRPTLLAHGKHRELTAPGWVADTTRLRQWLGPVCSTPLAGGLAATARWYREAGWL